MDFFHMGLVATGLFDYTLEHFFRNLGKSYASDCRMENFGFFLLVLETCKEKGIFCFLITSPPFGESRDRWWV